METALCGKEVCGGVIPTNSERIYLLINLDDMEKPEGEGKKPQSETEGVSPVVP